MLPQILMMHSEDDASYTRLVSLPDNLRTLTEEEVNQKVVEALDAAKKENPEEWNLEDDLYPALAKLGIEPVAFAHGPIWDNG